jgi:phenylalanyl-tRNA synthetase beta chain
MLIERKALATEIPAVAGMGTRELCELLASLGFPVDGVALREGTEILDVDITANRGDAMSHRGIAREIAAKLAAPLVPLGSSPVKETAPGLSICLETPACPIYATAILELGQGVTPAEVQAFLQALESTPKRLPAVDASNELLHSYGHPTHAFDADRIRGGISVRWARAGESLVTLDGVERKLDAKDLVIADETGPIALAGVMGGDGTKVSETTRRVLLESAWFDPKTVRASARRHTLHTDASHRFGRGADPAMATVARDLLIVRLQSWAQASLVATWTVGSLPLENSSLSLPLSLLTRVAGETLSLLEAAELLRRLGCRVETTAAALTVWVPSWRHDLLLPEDLAEEVLRLRGYERIPSVLPPLEGPPVPLTADYLHRQSLAKRLAHLGFHQTVTYGFVSPEMDAEPAERLGKLSPDDAASRVLANPLGLEYSVLRRSLVPSLLEVAERNLKQGQREVRLFEISQTFRGLPEGPQAEWTVGLAWTGEDWDEDPESKPVPVKAKHLMGVLKDVLKPGTPVTIQAPGDGTVLAAEFPLDAFKAPDARIIPAYQAQSRYPAVERDLSLLVASDLPWQTLQEAVQGALSSSALVGLTCADLYQGKNLELGTKAWLLRLSFQAMDRTLMGEEVEGWVALALRAAESLEARLRA